jgi:hypothetical protein
MARSTGGVTAGAVLQLNVSFYKWAPQSQVLHGAGALQPSATLPQLTVLSRATSSFTAELWEQLMVMVPTPADGAYASVRMAASGGAVVELFGISIA